MTIEDKIKIKLEKIIIKIIYIKIEFNSYNWKLYIIVILYK